MDKARHTVQMLRYECCTCDMTATVVYTSAAHLAWLDHMDTHSMKDNYRTWTWEVLPLFPDAK